MVNASTATVSKKNSTLRDVGIVGDEGPASDSRTHWIRGSENSEKKGGVPK